MLFPISEFWWLYSGFAALIVALLTFDLVLVHRKAHVIGFREASIWTCIWIAFALLFCGALYAFAAARFDEPTARRAALEFLTGYVVEQCLSLDNMFVFVMVFAYFGIPRALEHRVLFYGILGALVFRGIFISAGSALVRFDWVLVAFGVFLAATGIKMMLAPERKRSLEDAWILRWLRRVLPVTSSLHGNRFFVRQNGVLRVTPLLLTLLFMELTDVMFAIDSVPAVFAVTREPLIVFTSNIFAVLGLRSMYFLVAGAVVQFHLLRYAVAAILVFVGLKTSLLNVVWENDFPIAASLGIIALLLALGVGMSVAFPKKAAAGGSGA
jgi:tellurite resistance protein TerC